MKFSFTCMNGYPSADALKLAFTPTPRSLWDPETGKRAFTDALRLAALADDEGFDYVSVSEHHYAAGMVNPNPAVAAAALLAVVKNARLALLGPLVSMNNPVRIAEEIAMLDQMSGGRLTVLPLRGTPNEFPYYNVPAEETKGRTQEAVLLIQKALTEPEPFAWKSTHYDYPVISVWPGPTQTPHPPMFYSANSPDSAAFAAEHRFGAAQSFAGPKLAADRMRYYREQCAAHGWSPDSDQMLIRSFCVVGENAEHAADLMARAQGSRQAGLISPLAPPPPPEAGGQQPGQAADPVIDAAYAFGVLQFAGSSDEVAKQIRDYHELTGIGIYDLSFNFGYYTVEETADQIRLFAREVIPQLRDLSANPD